MAFATESNLNDLTCISCIYLRSPWSSQGGESFRKPVLGWTKWVHICRGTWECPLLNAAIVGIWLVRLDTTKKTNSIMEESNGVEAVPSCLDCFSQINLEGNTGNITCLLVFKNSIVIKISNGG